MSCNCPWSGRCTLYFFLLTAPLFLPPAAGHGEPVNSRVPLLQCDVAGERNVQRCRQKQKDRTSCDLFLATQTEIPLTGEMSRSDKRVTARYEQLEPVTLNMLSATAVASLYRNDKTIHRIVLSATDNSRVTLLRCDVAGERTVQRFRQK